MALQRSLAYIVLASLVSALALRSHAEDSPSKQPEKPRVLVTISKETTRITEPLRPDGYPNYLAAINKHASQGVTSDNNSAVLFWQAMGPEKIQEFDRDEFFKRLGMKRPPLTGHYYLSIHAFVENAAAVKAAGLPVNAIDEEKLEEQFDLATSRPWSAAEFPNLAQWLSENDETLKLVVAASKRPRRYEPMLAGRQSFMVFALQPSFSLTREISRVLTIRAMLHVKQHEFDLACDDVLACHRLARLYGQGPTTFDSIVGFALDAMACRADQSLLRAARLSRKQIDRMRVELAKLPAISAVAEKIDVGDRFEFLDCELIAARDGISTMARLAMYDQIGTSRSSFTTDLLNLIGYIMVDWDQVLREGNQDYDQLTEAYKQPRHADRAASVAKFEVAFQKRQADFRDPRFLVRNFLAGPRILFSHWISHAFMALFESGLQTTFDIADREEMQMQLVDLCYALAAYELDHGAYPEKIAELMPKYIAAIPKDIFNDADLHYQRKAGGYLLYSVGHNGNDDGASGHDDPNADQSDDIFVYVPAAPGKVK